MSRVLLVDDNADAVQATATLLAQWGHDARVVTDGRAALEVARVWRPEIVLLDIGLPGMDGFEVAAALRQEPSLMGCRILCVSGVSRGGDDESLVAAGVDQLLRKPIDIGFLRSLLGSATMRAG